MFRRTRATAVAALMCLTAAGCGVGEGSPDTIYMSLNTDPATFDPALAKSGDDYTVVRMLFDTLVRKDQGNTLAPGIAASWTAEDAAHYSFTLRGGLTCSDGTPITPSVVAASLNRFVSPQTGSVARTLALGTAKATFTADDAAGTVRAELTKPWADFLTGLALPQAGIVCPAGLADLAGLGQGTASGAFSGPYTLASSQPAVNYDLTLRAGYDAWPAFATPLEGRPARHVNFTPISDYSTIATQLLAGGLDVGTIGDESVRRFDGNSRFTSTTADNTTTYLAFNERPGSVFAGREDLRRAVGQAVDAQIFSDIISGARGSTTLSVGSAKVLCANTDPSLLIAPDLAAARRQLSGLPIRIAGTNLLQGGNDYVAEALRNAGAIVTLASLDNATWSTVTAAATGWDIDIQGDNNLMGTLTSSLLRVMGPPTDQGGRNKTGDVNDEGYAHLTQAMAQTDRAAQCDRLQAAQESFLRRIDAIPLATLPSTTFAVDGVSIRQFDDYLDPATLRIVR
ncbi:peptide ABC transporter substrate-binding protein [Amycolatopsis deserti]|uniref:Peptide ABC transporter substrate-binding protein n=1 Tax=Amycolatopsis deserti TaxID=185696 RepID=A0ABQ3IJS8_9PSEU|nr:ABC transporter substrate-binding protein [Amycolatopsis deserti]GHE84064.1 peptide ABC transporter substrate-binding protein [Amycolatopsis deserti]